ncbi:hypothetical protein FRB90_011407 [Tulasnella sp. 427]|nr:hypothetical protein FRB90_011407 [Tulasnella sp. 427]
MPPAPSPDTALKAILPLIAQGDAYSAHQKARTFASRYTKAKQYDVAVQVLFQSARELLKAGQPGSGTDLGGMLLDVYEAKDEKVNEESRGRLTQLIALTGPQGNWRDTLISKSVAYAISLLCNIKDVDLTLWGYPHSWSAKAGDCPAGDPDLHQYIGELFYKESEYARAESHLVSAGTRDSALLLAQLLFEWYQSALSTDSNLDPGLFALRGSVPYLTTTNILAARAFLDKFVSLLVVAKPDVLIHEEPVAIGEGPAHDEIWATSNHTLNFLQLAVRICQRGDSDAGSAREGKQAWIRLCGRYTGGVSGANTPGTKVLVVGGGFTREAVISLSHLYFNIQPPRSGSANPLGDMMSALFGGSGPSEPQNTRKAIGPGRGRGGGRGGGPTITDVD